MCGVSGFWGPRDRVLLEAMTAAQAHRGPDDLGFLETDAASLGFRRLSIIDLISGHQPMSTDDGLVHVSYNGEVYNYRELRAELEAVGHYFRTTCDTEVVLHAYAEWGTDCFARFNGMWGVAFLDQRGDAAPRRARPRPLRHQADVLRAVGRPRAVRVGDQGDPPGPHVRAPRRRPADVRVPRVRPVRPHRGHVLRGRARGPGRRVRDRRRQRRHRRALLGAGPVGDRFARPGRLPRRVRPRGGAPARRRRSRRHLPEWRARLVVDLHGDGRSARSPRPRLGVAGQAAPDVLRGVPRRPHRRDPLHRQRARGHRRGHQPLRADGQRLRPRDGAVGLAHRGADGVERAVRHVDGDAPRPPEGHGHARRPGRRRAARWLRPLPVRVPAGAAEEAPVPHVRARGVAVPRHRRPARAPSPRAAPSSRRRARAPRARARGGTEAPGRRPGEGRPEAPPAAGLHHVLVAAAVALRGPRVDGALARSAAPVPRPGAGRVHPRPARRRDHRARLEPARAARRPEGRAAAGRLRPPQEGRLHHARVPLVPARTCGAQRPAPLTELHRSQVLERPRRRRRVPARVRRRGRGVDVLLARDQRRSVDADLLRRRRHRARRPQLPRRLRAARRPRRRTRAPGRGGAARDREAQSGEPSLPADRRRHLRPGSVEVAADHARPTTSSTRSSRRSTTSTASTSTTATSCS